MKIFQSIKQFVGGSTALAVLVSIVGIIVGLKVIGLIVPVIGGLISIAVSVAAFLFVAYIIYRVVINFKGQKKY